MTETIAREHHEPRRARRSARWRWLWLLSIVAAWAVYPALTQNSGAVAYDAATEHIYRAVVFSRAISDGVLYPRWAQYLGLGLGSPLFTFQPPLPYYALDLLYRLGIPQPIGWRILIAGGLLLACAGAFSLVYAMTRLRWPALVAAAAYLYAPYVLRNALERGSNEAYSMFLYPWVLWGLIRLARRPAAGRFVAAGLIWAACIGSHVLGPLMLAPVAALLALALAYRYRTLAPVGALLAGVLLTAFIWAPMIPEQGWVHVERDFSAPEAIPAQNPIPLDRLLAPPAVYDVARDNNNTGDSIGLLQALLLLSGLPATIYAFTRRRHDLAFYLAAATVIGLLLFWLLTPASDAIWRTFAALLGRLLYRTRLMGLQALAAACAGGLVLVLIPRRWQPHAASLLASLLVLSALPALYLDLQHHYADFGASASLADVRASEIKAGGTALTAFGEFTPRWQQGPFDAALLDPAAPPFDPAAAPLAQPAAGVEISESHVTSSAWDVVLRSRDAVTVTLHLLYYPRWRAYLDGQPAPLGVQAGTGYAQAGLPAGEHRLALRYATTGAELAGLAISGLTLVLLSGSWLALRLRRTQGSSAAGDRPQQPLPVPDQSQGESAGQPLNAIKASRGSRDFQSPGEVVPAWWLLVLLTGCLAFKAFYLDGRSSWLRCTSTAAHVCGAQASVDVPFAGGPRLRGYSVSSYQLRRGDTLSVDTFWQGEPGPATRLRAFVHVRNSQPDWPLNPRSKDDIWAQADPDAPGGLLTTDYVPGKLYFTETRIRLPDDIPPGVYFLEIGWYDPASGEQLDPLAGAVTLPLKVLWRSVLLPSLEIR